MLNRPDPEGFIKSFTASVLEQLAATILNQGLTVKSASKTTVEKAPQVINNQPEIRLEGVSATTAPALVRVETGEESAFRSGLVDCLDNDYFEAGIKSATDHYVEKWLAINPIMVQVETGKVFLENRGNDRRLIGILNLISHMDINIFHPINELIAIGALSHNSTEIKECAIRAFEYWEDVNLIRSLKHHSLTPQWLDDYRLEVISDFCGDE